MKRFFPLILLITLFFPLFADTIDMKKKQLNYLQKEIEEKDKEIKKTKETIQKLDGNKKETDKKLRDTQVKIKNLTEQEKRAEKELLEFNKQASQTESYLNKAQNLWQKQVILLYFNQFKRKQSHEKIINDAYLPLMLNQARNSIDLNKKLLSSIQLDISKTTQTKKTIISNQQQANRSKDLLSKDITRIQREMKQLSENEKKIEKERQELENNRIALENLINMLQSELVAKEYKYRFTKPKLTLPVKGKVIKTFGQHKDETYNFVLINNGIDIQCDKDADVSAIDFGIVIFAERFRNYGRMIIIDHQNGFLSLYSNVGKILVTKNDAVELGQIIAIAGKKQDTDQYLLHFELRKDNEAIDPLPYFSN